MRAQVRLRGGAFPRLIALSAKQLQFVGMERYENAWVLQQWDCELL
jgi:hypothetical protein